MARITRAEPHLTFVLGTNVTQFLCKIESRYYRRIVRPTVYFVILLIFGKPGEKVFDSEGPELKLLTVRLVIC